MIVGPYPTKRRLESKPATSGSRCGPHGVELGDECRFGLVYVCFPPKVGMRVEVENQCLLMQRLGCNFVHDLMNKGRTV